jgi:hypothetical protein
MNATTLHPALASDPRPRPARRVRRRDRPAGKFLQTLCFLLGLSMPFISFAQRSQFTRSLFNRVEAVDLVCVFLLLALFGCGRLRLTWAFGIYTLALVISLAIATTTDTQGEAFTAFMAVMMAVLYYAVGRSIAEQKVLVKALLCGLLVSTLIESIIVCHDYFLPKWFPAKNSARVRGTFRSTAQLGGYGFTTAGILLSFGWAYFRSAWARTLVFLAGVGSCSFVLAATRRSGMFALLVWLGLFLLCGLKHISRRSYWIVVCCSIVAAIGLMVASTRVKQSYLFERFNDAYEQVAGGDSFTHDQFYKAIENIGMWFPFGVGVGQSPLVMVRYEAHNGHLAVIVELGLLGFMGYYGLWLPLARRKWADSFGRHTAMVKLVALTFVCAAAVIMIHARLNRDRSFMLFLGMIPLVAFSAEEIVRKVARRRSTPQPQSESEK